MRGCKDIQNKHKAFDSVTLNKMANSKPDHKAYATFKRKPYESLSDFYERMKKENDGK